ncbi:PREDICTED: uncharacterized protein LOC104805426 [Tarenaya hassleriana]|uniref:uncharacterized protein LOC104805426 n=1 Tax=Tarenaya hassleriana TaxID=28532 RepID=UPI00053C09DC|nr:PREDICTED: uncharacterized protein LOC104805426 [Tarenaya hassleriana]
MEESDKTTALKKAYAEIILNTAKEAAARVLVSERKAVRFQQDLCSSKEEALRLLVRLKQMIDAKTIEAEITSSNQQRRIDELEAQLQEAEDIITDLRSELHWVRDKLEKARTNNSQSLNATNTIEEVISTENADTEVIVSFHPNQGFEDTETKDSLANQSSLHNKCGNEVKQFDGNLEDCDVCESELDVVMRNKELELYRNGCTQRIRALERNVLEEKPPPHVEDQGTTSKDDNDNLSSGKVNETETVAEGNGRRCTVLALRASSLSVEVIKKPPNPLGTKKTSKGRTIRRRRKRRWGKPKASSLRSHACQPAKPCQSLSVHSCSKTSMNNASVESSSRTYLQDESEKVDVDALAVKACKGLEEHLHRKRTQYIDEIAIIRKGKRTKNMKSLDSIPSAVKPTDQLVEGHEESNLLPVNVKVDEDKAQIPETEAKIKPLPCLDSGLTLIKRNVDSISGSTNLTVSVKPSNQSEPGEDVLVKCENSVVSSTGMGSEVVDFCLDSPELKVAAVSEGNNESSRKFDGNRVVKYTFQRKRKKGALSDNDDNNISPAKMKVEEKENDESTLGNESSSGTRRLTQVAHQFISLSVKRW